MEKQFDGSIFSVFIFLTLKKLMEKNISVIKV
jgi:hypothetical protein